MDTTIHEEILIGHCDLNGLQEFPGLEEYFSHALHEYIIDPDHMGVLIPVVNEFDITIVLGTWCSDTRVQVPVFIRILQDTGYDLERLNIIAVNRQKTAEGTGLEEMEIEMVPTFIFYYDSEEAGRIVETPETTFEGDMVKIFVPALTR